MYILHEETFDTVRCYHATEGSPVRVALDRYYVISTSSIGIRGDICVIVIGDGLGCGGVGNASIYCHVPFSFLCFSIIVRAAQEEIR